MPSGKESALEGRAVRRKEDGDGKGGGWNSPSLVSGRAPFIVRHDSNIRSACTYVRGHLYGRLYSCVLARAQVFVRALAAATSGCVS